jgi:hypothetical protein
MIWLIIVFLHLDTCKTLLIPQPNLKHLERAGVVGAMPEIEEQALRLASYAFPRGFRASRKTAILAGCTHGGD